MGEERERERERERDEEFHHEGKRDRNILRKNKI
jgi:hypothetical protein